MIKDNQKLTSQYKIFPILLRFIFDSDSEVNVSWEKKSSVNDLDNEVHATHDFLFHTEFQELGCGEIKVNDADERLEEEDRARLAETMKKQLHHRIKQAKFTYEFSTFGIFVSDGNMELYQATFSRESGYIHTLLLSIKLPTFTDT